MHHSRVIQYRKTTNFWEIWRIGLFSWIWLSKILVFEQFIELKYFGCIVNSFTKNSRILYSGFQNDLFHIDTFIFEVIKWVNSFINFFYTKSFLFFEYYNWDYVDYVLEQNFLPLYYPKCSGAKHRQYFILRKCGLYLSVDFQVMLLLITLVS